MAQEAKLISSNITVVGGGNMGSGIAQKYAMHGHLVTIIDKDEKNLITCEKAINHSLDQGVQRAVFSAQDAQTIKSRLSFSTRINLAKEADLVIEAIFENLAFKQELFQQLDGLCNKNTVLATNTSSLKVADILCGLSHPERVLGLHYFYPPSKNRLVEIITTSQTSDFARDRAIFWQQSINKTVIHSQDSPGFIVNRFFVPWLNEAMRIVHEGKASVATVDKAAQTFFQITMGPFALMNATGLPITLHSCEALTRKLGDFYAPNPIIVPQIQKRALWNLASAIDDSALHDVALRLLTVVALLSCEMVFDDRVCGHDDVDVGAKVGLLWKKGPFELIKDHHREIANTIVRMKQEKLARPNTSAFLQFVETLP